MDTEQRRRADPPPTMGTFRYLVVLTLIVVGIILGLELGGRAYIHLAYGKEGRTYGIYQAHPVLGGILRPDSYNLIKEFNNRGFQSSRDVPASKPQDELRIVTYGGSTTFCYNLPTGEDWPLQLEDRLRERGTNARVLNAGDVSWSLGHINVRSREEFAELDADWVVLYSGLNEYLNADDLAFHGINMADEVAAGRLGTFTRLLSSSQWLHRNSLIYKATIRWFLPLFGDGKPRVPPFKADPEALDINYRHLLRGLIPFWREHGARVLFVVQGGDPAHEKHYITGMSRNAADLARELGAVVVDANEVVRAYPGAPAELFTETGVHWTRDGARRLSEFLAERVPWSP
ncbi:MAG: SGNH/GDSL hydrolase family protein [Gammaproteobacteria bacterium]